MAREKKVIKKNIEFSDYEQSLADYAKSEAKLRKINAEIDLQNLRIKDKYASEIEANTKQKSENFDVIHQYCTENKDILFTDKKSMETAYGKVGFRLGTPKVQTKKGFTWASVLTLIKKVLPEYVRTKEEVNKEYILANKEKLNLEEVGIVVYNEETFFIEVKTEEN